MENQNGTNGMSVAGFVCSLVSFPFIVTGILGLAFGIVGLKRAKELGGRGKVMSILAICISSLVFLVLIIAFVDMLKGGN